MLNDVEALRGHVHLPHLKLIVVDCCYRSPDADADYLTQLCEVTDRVSDVNNEIYLLGDMNIDWIASDCPRKKKYH